MMPVSFDRGGDAPTGHHGPSGPPAGDRDWLWWLPRLLFIVGAVALCIISAVGPSLTLLYIGLAIFGGISVFFVGRQLLRGHQPGPWPIPTGIILSSVGLAALITYVWVKLDALPLLGSVLLVLGLGWLVEAWRTGGRPGRLLGWGLASLGVSFVLGLVAVVGLGSARGAWYATRLIVLGAAVLVVLPVGLNLLSEYGLRQLAKYRQRGPRTTAGSAPVAVRAGAVTLAVVAGFIGWLLSTDWILTAIAVTLAVVLLLAIVSNTHADVALVLAGLVLIGAAPPEQPMPEALTSVGSNTLVVLGDSYTSGEGAAAYFSGTDDAGGNQCRRAPSAYAVRLATDRYDHVVFLACSGARTRNVISRDDDPDHAQAQAGESGTQIDQLKELKRRNPAFQPALVIVGLGGNDAGFGTLAETCLAPGDCSAKRDLFEQNLPSVGRALTATYSSLQRALPNVPVLAVPYPQPIANTRTCDGVAFTGKERNFIREFVNRLDDTVQTAANNAGVAYAADLRDSLQMHRQQLCGTRKNQAGVNFVDVLSVNGVTSQRFNPARWIHNSLHPNYRGHDAMLSTLVRWVETHSSALSQQESGQAGGNRPSATVPADGVSEPKPQCSMTDANESSCQTLTRQWVLRQATERAWVLILVMAALMVVWTASIAVQSGLRRRSASP